MKNIKEIIKQLRNIRFEVSKINMYLSDCAPRKDDHLAAFVADSAPDLQCVLRNVAENQVPPIELGEYYIVKISKRNF